MLVKLLRISIRSKLIRNGSLTCSELVRLMNLDPARHKGTIHALMVDLEQAGVLAATRRSNGQRDRWYVARSRKRDLLASLLFA